MLRSDHDGAVPARHGIVVGDRAHCRADAVEDAFGVVRDMVGDAVRRLRGQHEHCGVFGTEPLLDMIGRPWIRRLVLSDAVSLFAGMSERALVQIAWPA